jgi:uncharacterized membrane protein YbhN (UPF0104 family)
VTSENGRHHRRARFLLRAVASSLFVVFLVHRLDLQRILEAGLLVDRAGVAISYLVFVGAELVIALRLRLLLQATPLRLSTLRLLRIGFISNFYAVLLPAGVGQPLAKWFKIADRGGSRIQLALVLAVEKALLLSTTTLSIGVPVLLVRDAHISHIRTALITAFAALGTATALFFFALLVGPSTLVPASLRAVIPKYLGRPASRVSAGLSVFEGRWALLLLAWLLTLVFQVAVVIRIALLFASVGVDLHWSATLWISSLVFLLQAVPISIAGLGVRESAFALAVGLYGLAPETGVTVGLLFFAQMSLDAIVGGVLEWTDRRSLSDPSTRRGPRSRPEVASAKPGLDDGLRE